MSVSTNDLKNGMTIDLPEGLFQVVEFQHVKPGKGGAFVRTKLRNVRLGTTVERTFRADEKLEQAVIDKREMQYLYADGEDMVFMDTQSYDQMQVPPKSLGDAALHTTAIGYCLDADVDAEIFSHDIAEAAAGSDRIERLERALALWVGAALEEFASEDWAAGEVARLSELRASATEDLAAAMIAERFGPSCFGLPSTWPTSSSAWTRRCIICQPRSRWAISRPRNIMVAFTLLPSFRKLTMWLRFV